MIDNACEYLLVSLVAYLRILQLKRKWTSRSSAPIYFFKLQLRTCVISIYKTTDFDVLNTSTKLSERSSLNDARHLNTLRLCNIGNGHSNGSMSDR